MKREVQYRHGSKPDKHGRYNQSLRPGGVNDHIGRRGRAIGGKIVNQSTGLTLAEWRAPMFTTDESDFDVLYKD